MNKGSNKNKWLIIGLAALGAAILALVIVIIVFVNNTPEGEKCAAMDGDARSVCLAEIVNKSENEMEIDEAFDSALNKLLRDKDYISFTDVLFDRLDMLIMDSRCDDALRKIDDSRLEQLPDTDLAYYYSMMMNVALECNDEAKYDELDEKYWALEEKGGIYELPLDENDEEIDENIEREWGFEEERKEEE